MTKELLSAAISFSKAGYTVFKAFGKHPEKGLKWRQHPYTLPSEIEDYFGEDYRNNYALALSEQQLVIDIDPRNFKLNDKPHQRLFKDAGLEFKSIKDLTTVVQTGGGGLHVYLRLPTLPDNKKIRKINPKYQGIDFLTSGAYCMGAGSIHPQTNQDYKILQPTDRPLVIAEAPQALLDIILKDTDTNTLTGIEGTKDGDMPTVSRYKEFLEMTPEAVEGESGDQVTYKVACKGRDLGLSAQMVFDLMAEHYNHRCSPEWPLEELQKKVRNAYDYASKPLGNGHPEADFQKVAVIKKHKDWRGWDRSQKGSVKTNLNNTINFFRNYHEAPSPLHKSLIFNEFALEITKSEWMPWDKSEGKKMPKGGVEWMERDSVDLKAFLSIKKKFDATRNIIDEAVETVAREQSFHPVREYLRGLQWDGKERLETWLTYNSGAIDNTTNRAISKLIIMQAVARGLIPGCQVDIVPILEGAQGIYKTTLVRILGGEWYSDIKIDPRSKDTPEAMRGRWIIEMSEMVSYKKADIDEMKAFISKTFDRYRAPYARKPMNVLRQSVFIATINPDDTGTYLNDTTGNRRFAPINLGDQKINTDSIIKMRDQLFAEATHRILLGEPWHITDREVNAELLRETKKRQTIDAWQPMISEYINGCEPFFVTTSNIWVEVLAGRPERLGQLEQRRIAVCLKEMGYHKKARRENNKVVHGYENLEYQHSHKRSEELFE